MTSEGIIRAAKRIADNLVDKELDEIRWHEVKVEAKIIIETEVAGIKNSLL